jgi:hypothetical protein
MALLSESLEIPAKKKQGETPVESCTLLYQNLPSGSHEHEEESVTVARL